jgi:hypothetical protein
MITGAVNVFPQRKLAGDAITAKAKEKKAVLGEATGSLETIEVFGGDTGFVQRFQFGAVYYTLGTGAHEVNGDISAKYDLLGGPRWNGNAKLTPLGFPVSDERDALDRVGKVSDFQHGSIYWHPRTGPMLVHEVLNNAYQKAGGEIGSLGFPTRDTHAWKPIDPRQSHLVWGLFEAGCIASNLSDQPKICGSPDTATITADDLKTLVRHFIDKAVHKNDVNIGLQPEIDIIHVSDWQKGLEESLRRKVTYRLFPFKDMGLVLPDVKMTLEVDIQFDWEKEPSLYEGPSQTLIAVLPDPPVVPDVTILGIPLAHGYAYPVDATMYVVSAVPVDLPGSEGVVRVILDMIVTPAGGLQFFTNPYGLGPGGSFGPKVQQEIDDHIGELLRS